jgi:hypothetical protein
MQRPNFRILALTLLWGIATGLGCSKSTPPPTPLTVGELPAALEKAFSTAQPELKDLAHQVVAAVQGGDYPKAFRTIQTLASKPGLTKEQVNTTARATLTVNSLLQAAESKGDARAAQTLKTYRGDK